MIYLYVNCTLRACLCMYVLTCSLVLRSITTKNGGSFTRCLSLRQSLSTRISRTQISRSFVQVTAQILVAERVVRRSTDRISSYWERSVASSTTRRWRPRSDSNWVRLETDSMMQSMQRGPKSIPTQSDTWRKPNSAVRENKSRY